jgi:L-iditol 2-dehydrogenase
VTIDGREDVSSKVRQSNGGILADLVITGTGAPSAIRQGLGAVDRGGTVLFFAPTDAGRTIEIPFNDLWKDEVTTVSSYGASPRDIQDAIRLLKDRRVEVKDLISHVLPLAKASEGFRLVSEAKDSMKVVLRP